MNFRLASSVSGRPGLALAVLALWLWPWPSGLRAQAPGSFNQRGNLLIADQANNRVLELDAAHNVVWSFGDGSSVPGPTSVVAPRNAERVGGTTFICGGGAPPSSHGCPGGCPDHRVIGVNPEGQIVWQYGQAGVAGSGPGQLNTPVHAAFLSNYHMLITDQGNQRVIEVDWKGNLVWQYGQTGVAGSGPGQLNAPASAEKLPDGNVLIADMGNNRVLEVTPDLQVAWTYSDTVGTCALSRPSYASRLPNGNTLVTDSDHARIAEVDPTGAMIFQYNTNLRPGSVSRPWPTRAVRLASGNTLIADQYNQQVIVINPDKQVIYTHGTLKVPGSGADGLNRPCDAKVIGDYNGQTDPCPH